MNKKQKKFYWKVVYVNRSGQFLSATIMRSEVNYSEKNVWIYPNPNNNQFLFIFDTLQNASCFRQKYLCPRRYKILKVKAEGISTYEEGKYNDFSTTDYPDGTLFCKRLMVIGDDTEDNNYMIGFTIRKRREEEYKKSLKESEKNKEKDMVIKNSSNQQEYKTKPFPLPL